MGQPQSFRAICPDTKLLHVFQIVSENGKTMGWCTKCRKLYPFEELTDGKTGETELVKDKRPPRKKKT